MAGSQTSRFKVVLEDGLATVIPFLKAVNQASNVFPPLQSATGIAIAIGEAVQKFRSNREDWTNFGQFVQDAIVCVIESLTDTKEPKQNLKDNIWKLKNILLKVEKEIASIKSKSTTTRFLEFHKDPDRILQMKKEIQDAISIFHLSSMVTIRQDVSEILKCIQNKLGEKIIRTIYLDKLPYVRGASWNPAKTCLEGTRVELLDEIMTWIKSDSQTAKVFWLADVAGAGKSSMAHTVARECEREGILASSFFFDREVAGRNVPQNLFSTIARDLAVDEDFAEHICNSVEHNPSLATAPIQRQFEQLIMEPSNLLTKEKPIVVVIDSLDEGYDHDIDLLTIFRDRLADLPRNFRILITSRAEEDIVVYLDNSPHIERHSMKIYEQSNKNDISMYSRHRLRAIAERRLLGNDWPDQKRANAFEAKAAGLFIWVATVCDFLMDQLHPLKHLDALLSMRATTGLRAEIKMDKLYSQILGTCKWEDDDFATGYYLLMGSIMAAKIPLSASALKALHGSSLQFSVIDVLRPLGSLLTGLTNERDPIRILHQSFRDFLTVRAHNSPGSLRYFIDEKEHSQKLALICLDIMNAYFTTDIGDLSKRIAARESIDELVGVAVSEELLYACKFWMNHLSAVIGSLSHKLNEPLRVFLFSRLLSWIEFMGRRDVLQDATLSLRNLRTWLQTQLPNELDLSEMVSDALRFVQTFSTIISENPLHVYSSGLPFTPNNTLLSKIYLPLYPQIPRVIAGLHQQWSPEIFSFSTHDQLFSYGVRALSWSHDGSQIAIHCDLGDIYLWSLERGVRVRLTGTLDYIFNSLQFSPDDSMVATCSHLRRISVWKTAAKEMTPIHIFNVDNNNVEDVPISLAFSSDNNILASGSVNGSVHAWYLASDPLAYYYLSGHSNWVACLAFMPGDGRLVSCSGDGMVCIWDMATRQLIHQSRSRRLTGVNSMSISPSGSLLAVGFYDGSFKVESIGLETDAIICTAGFSVAHSRDYSRYLLSSPNGISKIYNSHSNTLLETIDSAASADFVQAIFSPKDNAQVVARGKDGSVYIYGMSADPSLRVIATNVGSGGPIIFSEDGLEIFFSSVDGTICTWNIKSSLLKSLAHTRPTAGSSVLSLCPSPDKQKVAAFYDDAHIRIWNVNSSDIVTSHDFTGKVQWINRMLFSPDSGVFAAGTSNGFCHLFDIALGKWSLRGPEGYANNPIVGLLFKIQSDSLYVVAQSLFSNKWQGRVWNTYTRGTYPLPPPRAKGARDQSDATFVEDGGSMEDIESADLEAVSVYFSSDSQKLATTSSSHTLIHIWDIGTYLPLAGPFTTKGLEKITRVSFSPDTRRIAAGSVESVVRVWETIAPPTAVIPPSQKSKLRRVQQVEVSLDGSRAAVVSWTGDGEDNDECTKIYNTETGEPIGDASFASAGCYSPDSTQYLALSAGHAWAVMDLASGSVTNQPRDIFEKEDEVDWAQYSPDSKNIITKTKGGALYIWYLYDKSKQPCFLGKAFETTENNSIFLALSDSTWVVNYTPYSPTFRIWSMDGVLLSERIDLDYDPSSSTETYSTDFRSDGLRFASLHRASGKLQVLDSLTLSVIFTGTAQINNPKLLFVFSGSFIAVGEQYSTINNQVSIWDVDSGNSAPSTLEAGHISTLAFSSDNSMLAVSGDTMKAWDLKTLELVKEYDYRLQDEHIGHFIRHVENERRGITARPGVVCMDDDGWIRTTTLEKSMWVPIDYRGSTIAGDGGGNTFALPSAEGDLIIIRFPESWKWAGNVGSPGQ